MAETKRSPLDFGLGERGFVQRFILAEVLGPPKGRAPRGGVARDERPPAPPSKQTTEKR